MRDDCTVVAKREHGERATPISLLELELVGDLDSFAEHLLTIAVSALAHLVKACCAWGIARVSNGGPM
jgi:hypothetical protein